MSEVLRWNLLKTGTYLSVLNVLKYNENNEVSTRKSANKTIAMLLGITVRMKKTKIERHRRAA